MGEVLFGILFILLGFGTLSGTVYWVRNCDQIEERDRRIAHLEAQLEEVTYKYNMLLMKQYSKEATQKVIYKTVNTNSQVIKEAVRYAMLKSHPDNGGKQEDFIKFRKLYEGMK